MLLASNKSTSKKSTSKRSKFENRIDFAEAVIVVCKHSITHWIAISVGFILLTSSIITGLTLQEYCPNIRSFVTDDTERKTFSPICARYFYFQEAFMLGFVQLSVIGLFAYRLSKVCLNYYNKQYELLRNKELFSNELKNIDSKEPSDEINNSNQPQGSVR